MRSNGGWHVHAERGEYVRDIPGCSEHEAQFWTRNLISASADVTVTEPDGTIRQFSGSGDGQ